MALPDIAQDLRADILQECATEFARGSLPMMQLIALRQQGGSLPQRVNYMLAGIDTLGTLDLRVLSAYFDHLNSSIPAEDMAMHQAALSLVFSAILKKVMDMAGNVAQAIAGVMHLSEELHINTTVESAEQSEEVKSEEIPVKDSRVLH